MNLNDLQSFFVSMIHSVFLVPPMKIRGYLKGTALHTLIHLQDCGFRGIPPIRESRVFPHHRKTKNAILRRDGFTAGFSLISIMRPCYRDPTAYPRKSIHMDRRNSIFYPRLL